MTKPMQAKTTEEILKQDYEYVSKMKEKETLIKTLVTDIQRQLNQLDKVVNDTEMFRRSK